MTDRLCPNGIGSFSPLSQLENCVFKPLYASLSTYGLLIAILSISYSTHVSAEPTELVIGGLSVLESKPDGTPWDLGFGAMARPDLVTEVWLGDELLLETPKASNTHSAAQVMSSPIFELTKEQEVVIKVIDKDLRADDLVEQFSIKVNLQDLKTYRRFELSGKSVISLTVQVKPPASNRFGPPQRDTFVPPPTLQETSATQKP